MAMNATAIRFDENEKEWIQSYAGVLGISFSEFVRNAALEMVEDAADIKAYKVQEHLDGCEDPRRAPNGKQLQGTDSGWRWRVGVYRILARIEDGRAIIEVVRVGHRQGVYKNMPRL